MRLRMWMFVFTLWIGTALAPIANAQTGSFTVTGNPNRARIFHTATLLSNGQVLVAGGNTSISGIDSSAELYSPATGTFAYTGSLRTARESATATLLSSGQVLVAGGVVGPLRWSATSTAELYNAATSTFSYTNGNLNTARSSAAATLLTNGKILITGGLDSNAAALASVELYDPSTGKFSYTGNLNVARSGHTSTLLNNGKVLIAGGSSATAELYDPTTGTFTYTGTPLRATTNATPVSGGNVLLTTSGSVTSEIYNPASGTFSATGNSDGLVNLAQVILTDGRVLIVGGNVPNGASTTEAEVYDVSAGSFSQTGSLHYPRELESATLLSNGEVLVVGGSNTQCGRRGCQTFAQGGAELYTPGGLVGYVDPKFVVVGVTYAPPGPSPNTFVNYTNSTTIGTTNSISQSFMSGDTFSVSLSFGQNIPMVSKGSITAEYSLTSSQKNMNTSTVTTTYQTSQGEKTGGTGSYWAPVDNDYDIVWVWLNPAVILTVSTNKVTWNGYGLDATDQPGMDIVGIQLGYLNGHFGSMPPDIQTSINRAWAANQTWPAGQGPALTAADLAQIAAADPFSVSTYGTNYLGYNLPSPETADFRFTMSSCTSQASFDYLQAAPSQAPATYTCTLNYTNNSTQAKSITTTNTQEFSIDASVSVGFILTLSRETKNSQTFTWTTGEDSSISNSTSSTAQFSVQGPPCNNVVPEQGPCVPVYDSAGNQPTQFYVYEDNMFGTFMFAPVHFY